MAYTKTVWQDQEGQVRYTETTDGDYKIFTPNYEEVTTIGTPVNALNMNNIENGVEYCDANMVKRASLSSATGNSTTPVYVKDNGEVFVCSREIPDIFSSNGISNLFFAMTANFSAGVSMAISTTHTATTDGFIAWQVTENDSTRNLLINDVIVARARATGSHDGSGTAAFLPVAKGSTYYCNKGALTFYPLNGV